MSVYDFCHTVCGAKCCRTGKLNLKERELATVLKGRREELEKSGRLVQEWDGTWTLILPPACPALGPDNKCTVYEERPHACREFPMFTFSKDVVTVDWCPLIQTGRLNSHLKGLREKGARIV